MSALEKVLEEINVLIEKHKNKAFELVEKEPLTQCYTETDIEQIKVHELAAMKEIIRSHMDEAKNDEWIDCQKVMPGQDMDKKPVWIVYGSPMHLSVEFAYCEWILAEDEYGNDDSYNQFYIPQAPCLYYPSPNLVHYWKAVNIPKFKKE